MIEYQPTWRYAVTATMNIARNTRDIPINGIFANRSMRAMRPTSIDRMTVLTVNTFRRCGGGEMELRADWAPATGTPPGRGVCRVTAVTGFALAFRHLSRQRGALWAHECRAP